MLTVLAATFSKVNNHWLQSASFLELLLDWMSQKRTTTITISHLLQPGCPNVQSMLSTKNCMAFNAMTSAQGKSFWLQQNAWLGCKWIPLGGNSPQTCICSVPAQEMAKHHAKFGWPPLNDVSAIMKPRQETH